MGLSVDCINYLKMDEYIPLEEFQKKQHNSKDIL